MRQTKQKLFIFQALVSEARPMTPQEILEKAKISVPRLSLGTVYRVIRGLLDDGEIAAVPVPGEADRYELQSMAAHHHHHFHCTGCRRAFDIPGCGLTIDAHLPPGFSVFRHEVMLYGSCRSCAETV